MDTDIIVLRHRVDWAALLSDLRTVGVTGYRLAELLRCEWSTVQRWQQGSEPRHSYGSAIIEVHGRFCGNALTQQRLTESELVP